MKTAHLIAVIIAFLIFGLGLWVHSFKKSHGFGTKNYIVVIDALRDEHSQGVLSYLSWAQKRNRFQITKRQWNSQSGYSYKNKPLPEYERALKEGLKYLDFVKPEILRPCTLFKYYGLRSELETKLTIYGGQPEDTDAAELIRRHNVDMQAWASQYFGEPVNYSDLENWAETEISGLKIQYAKLKTELGIADLDAYALQNSFFESEPGIYRTGFLLGMAQARNAAAHRFYDYDLNQTKVLINGKCHRYKAYASYGYSGSISIYQCGKQLDIKRNMFLAAHEYYPGHHLQFGIKRQQKLCKAKHRTRLSLSEGWANYGEFLEVEQTYSAPEQLLGWMDYRFIRAMRILVDIARHRDGASKPELRILWDSRTPDRLHSRFEEEFIRIKGFRNFQHLTYIAGRKAILKVRSRLEEEMGSEFDEKRFHHILLTAPIETSAYLYEQVKVGLAIDLAEEFSVSESTN